MVNKEKALNSNFYTWYETKTTFVAHYILYAISRSFQNFHYFASVEILPS
jgi:hypothetical protein